MQRIDRTIESIDGWQRRNRPAAFVYGVIKKYGNDRGGTLAGLIAYYGFLSMFPLLLLLITVVGLATGGSASAVHRVEHSALSQFPVVGSDLAGSIHSLHDRAGIGLAVGLVGLLWGSQGAAQAAQYAMAEVWDVPLVERPGYVARMVRTLAVVGAVGVFVLASTALAGVVTVGNRGGLEVAGAVVVSLVLNAAVYAVAFRLLTPSSVRWAWLLPGAAVGGTGWTVLQYVGGALVDHTLRHTSQVYGFFAVVLGLLAWIALGAQLSLYAAEVNVVLRRRLWPRSLRAPLTEADRDVLRRNVLQQRSRADQRVSVAFERDAEAADDEGDDGEADDDEDGHPAGAAAAGGHARRRPDR